MPRVSAAFFFLGGLLLLAGMSLGQYMGAHEDFTLAPVHAHINLLGWVTLALYGTFYALTRETYSPRLAWINFVLSAIGGAQHGAPAGYHADVRRPCDLWAAARHLRRLRHAGASGCSCIRWCASCSGPAKATGGG